MKRLFVAGATLSIIFSFGALAGAQDVPAEYQQVLTALGKTGDYKRTCSRSTSRGTTSASPLRA